METLFSKVTVTLFDGVNSSAEVIVKPENLFPSIHHVVLVKLGGKQV